MSTWAEKTCGNKMRYANRESAERAMNELIRAGKKSKWLNMTRAQIKAGYTWGVYECPICTWWHVGRSCRKTATEQVETVENPNDESDT